MTREGPRRWRVAVVGRGRLGLALARALREAGVPVRRTAGRCPSERTLRWADVVVLAVPEGAMLSLAASIAEKLRAGSVLLGTSGSLPAERLRYAVGTACPVGVLHPLVALAGSRSRVGADSCFVLWGDPEARRRARWLVQALGARCVERPLHGAAYHAAATLVAQGAALLGWMAEQVWRTLGVSERQARWATASLLHSVARNAETVGLPEGATGPLVRGASEVVRQHRRALRPWPEVSRLYEALLPAARSMVAASRAQRARGDRAEAATAGPATPATPPRRPSTGPG